MLKKIFCAPLIQISLLVALLLAAMLWPFQPLVHLENRHFDFWAERFHNPGKQPVAIVAIDSKSMQKIGDWPWPRTRIAEMVRLLSAHGAEAVGLCLLYSHADTNPGLMEIRELRAQSGLQKWPGGKQTLQMLDDMLKSAEKRLDQDVMLIDAVRSAKNAVLPMRFAMDDAVGDGDAKLSGLLIINSLRQPEFKRTPRGVLTILGKVAGGEEMAPVNMEGVQETFTALAGKAGALGHLNYPVDMDGRIRRVPMLVAFKERLFPALALQLALKYIDADLKDLIITVDSYGQSHVTLKPLQLSSDAGYGLLLNHNRHWLAQRTYSFADVFDGRIDPSVFREKIILIGVINPDLTPSHRIGRFDGVSTVELTADVLARILSTDRLSRPPWTLPLEIVVLLYFALFLIFVIPRVNMRIGVSILVFFLATWYAGAVGLMMGYGYWIKVQGPILLAVVGFVLIQLTIYSRNRQQEKYEINKTLGLSYQGQGMLDMAYEKFIECPVETSSVKSLLYNLGLDFERKRMFNKALAIYQHIITAGKFKDTDSRIARLKAMADPLGLSTTTGLGEDTLKEDTGAMPTFGRYEIVRTLGRGAMGTIYLGRDPKINREVAIKTMEYGEVETSELPEVKARFFREAEAAGKLSHPNIVAIFDAGEEHDMAYIAMELLTGKNLAEHCSKENLLPLPRTLSIIGDVAAALDYAHKNGVVHRDIKPANIMLTGDERVKVTDFGIARVVDATQTRTGIILGTPSYMSPEQVAGKKVDGRSDLFALGAVFYQLLTGSKPFQGDNLTAIMYAITHTAYTPLAEVLPDIPPCVEAIVKKMLAKGLTKRFHTAAQVSKAVHACRMELKKSAAGKTSK